MLKKKLLETKAPFEPFREIDALLYGNRALKRRIAKLDAHLCVLAKRVKLSTFEQLEQLK